MREVVITATRALVGVAARSLAEVNDDVTLPQYRVLVLLHGRGSQTMGELADALEVNPSTVTRVCDVLVDKALIRRAPARDNRRTVCAELTTGGRRLVDHVMNRRRRLVDDALARMPADAQRRLARALAELAEALGEVSADAWMLGWPIEPEAGDGSNS